MSIYHAPGNDALVSVLSTGLSDAFDALDLPDGERSDRVMEVLGNFEGSCYDIGDFSTQDVTLRRKICLIEYARMVVIPELLWEGYMKFLGEWVNCYGVPGNKGSSPTSYAEWAGYYYYYYYE